MAKHWQVKQVFTTQHSQPRRVLIFAAALALSGCATVVPKAPPQAPPPPKAVETPPAIPTNPAALPQDEGRHRVALLVPITGRNAAVGQAIANAANMAVLDTGAER